MMMKLVFKGLESILDAGSFNKMVSHFSNKYLLETKGRVSFLRVKALKPNNSHNPKDHGDEHHSSYHPVL